MAIAASPAPSERYESLANDFTGMWNFLVDPVAAARRLPRKWFWIAPVLALSIAAFAYMFVMTPIMEHFLQTAPMPADAPPEQFAKRLQITMGILRIETFAMPVIIVLMALIQSGILLGSSSVLAVRTTFRELFNLVTGCGIISALQTLAWMLILRFKGEISNANDVRPPLGLDIFLGDGANKVLAATLGYFSIFQIWWIVMLTLTYSVGFRVSKGKALTAVSPILILGFLLAIAGAVFQRS